jgi:choline dehydrogenase
LRNEEARLQYLRESLMIYFRYAERAGWRPTISPSSTRSSEFAVSRLRVADTSVMTSPVSGDSNATVFAIAGRAAQLIAG